MASSYGNNIRITVFGQSHGKAIGVTIEGLPPGMKVDGEALQAFLARRAPGRSDLSTARREADKPEFVSGLVGDVTCGTPLTALIWNGDFRPQDYGEVQTVPRPGHADWTGHVRYGGFEDPTGGGHFSGRLTAPLCIAGGLCIQLLRAQGIEIGAHAAAVGGVEDQFFDPVNVKPNDFTRLRSMDLPVLDDAAGCRMREVIAKAKEQGDSVGGVIECAVLGLPAGIGDPMMDGLESRIASLVFSIPAVKGVEFGSGFAAACMRGSQNNDPYLMENGCVRTATNHCGGILGGISTGMPLIFRAAVKPTPSIAQEQASIDWRTGQEAALRVKGRHDPCIVPRAVPCIEAAAAIALLDAILEKNKYQRGDNR